MKFHEHAPASEVPVGWTWEQDGDRRLQKSYKQEL